MFCRNLSVLGLSLTNDFERNFHSIWVLCNGFFSRSLCKFGQMTVSSYLSAIATYQPSGAFLSIFWKTCRKQAKLVTPWMGLILSLGKLGFTEILCHEEQGNFDYNLQQFRLGCLDAEFRSGPISLVWHFQLSLNTKTAQIQKFLAQAVLCISNWTKQFSLWNLHIMCFEMVTGQRKFSLWTKIR